MNKIIELGFIPKVENGDGKKHQSNIVYSITGLSPCIAASWCVKQPPAMIIVGVESGITTSSATVLILDERNIYTEISKK